MNVATSGLKQLPESEIRQFIEEGFVVVRRVFSRNLAEDILPLVWAKLDIDPNNPAAWTQSYVILKKVLHDEPIPQIFTHRYVEAVDDLCGMGRGELSNGVGHWPIAFPGFGQTHWQPLQNAWHLDSNTDRHCLNSPKLGLIALHLFTDIAPGGGGTAIRIGSHRYTARILAEAGAEGVPKLELSRRAAAATNHLPYREITGQAGDVLFMHPFTVHAGSTNTSARVRVLGHKLFPLREPMNFERNNPSDYSPVELAVVNALSETKNE